MKNLIVATAVALLIVGCGGGSSTSEDNSLPSTSVEVSGPGAAFEGATEFSADMIAGQSVYEWNDINDDGIATRDEWLRATFESNGDLLFERNGTSEIAGSYTVIDGKIIATTVDGDKTIMLNAARATEWDITFVEDNESTTWFLELKYSANILVGKRFSVEFDPIVAVEYAADNTAKGYDTDGNIIGEIEYVIKDGILIHRPAEDADERYLMKVKADGSLLAWHPVELEVDTYTLIK